MSTLDTFRRPEYTGDNRCLPCTIVNSFIALIAAAAIALVWVPAGMAALGVFAGTIYLRGYLVPKTPELTQRYFPESVLRAFGKEPVEPPAGGPSGSTGSQATAASEPGDGDPVDPEAVETQLLEAGVVEEDEREDDLQLTETFRDDWWRRIRWYRGDETDAKARLGTVLDIDPDGIGFRDESRFIVTYEGDRIGAWDSDAAFYADLAVEPTLKEWLPDWEELGDRRRTELIAGMRAFLETCPACEAALEPVENVRESCCSSQVVGVTVDCEACGALVFSGQYR